MREFLTVITISFLFTIIAGTVASFLVASYIVFAFKFFLIFTSIFLLFGIITGNQEHYYDETPYGD